MLRYAKSSIGPGRCQYPSKLSEIVTHWQKMTALRLAIDFLVFLAVSVR